MTKRQGTFLITGGSGLIGSRFARRLLDDGQKVRILDTRHGELSDVRNHPNLEFFGIARSSREAGMVDWPTVYRAMRRVDVVYHFAINWNGYSWRHALPLPDLFDANIRGTINLLEAAKSQKIRHFLYSSTAAVYGETQRTLSIRGRSMLKHKADEESPCKPYLWDGDPGPEYAILKLALEELCLMYNHAHGLPVTVFRVEYVFTDEEQLRDGANVHVADVIRAFQRATLNKAAFGQVFNLAYPTRYISTTKIQRTLGWRPQDTIHFLRTRIAKVQRTDL